MALPPRALLVALTGGALTVIAVLGGILPRSTVPLAWYVPAIDSVIAATLLFVLVLAASDVVVRRHARLLPVAVSSLALALVWLAHGLTFPGVLPISLALTSSQTAAGLFHFGHVARRDKTYA